MRTNIHAVDTAQLMSPARAAVDVRSWLLRLRTRTRGARRYTWRRVARGVRRVVTRRIRIRGAAIVGEYQEADEHGSASCEDPSPDVATEGFATAQIFIVSPIIVLQISHDSLLHYLKATTEPNR